MVFLVFFITYFELETVWVHFNVNVLLLFDDDLAICSLAARLGAAFACRFF